MGKLLEDPFFRTFRYLRLSVTKACNFRCSYCLPEGAPRVCTGSELSVSEISNLVRGLAELGVTKVRLTGGEPTTRLDILDIANAVSSVPGIEEVALTTNGYRLKNIAAELQCAGVSAINVSVDSLDRARFHEITGQDRFDEVICGIDRVLEVGSVRMKVNVVLLRDWNELEVATFIDWTKNTPVSVRFIELMRTGHNSELFERRHVSAELVREALQRSGWARRESGPQAGPALEWGHPEHLGTVGVIAPYSHGFCEGCNRLRVTSEGALRLCLFGESDYSLRPLLQDESQREELRETIVGLLKRKPATHLLHEGKFGNVRDLARIGG